MILTQFWSKNESILALFPFYFPKYILQILIHILFTKYWNKSDRIMSKNDTQPSIYILTKILAFSGVIGALFDLEAEKEGQKVEPALGINWTRLTAKALMYLVLTTGPKSSSNQSTSGMYISASGSSNSCNLFLHHKTYSMNHSSAQNWEFKNELKPSQNKKGQKNFQVHQFTVYMFDHNINPHTKMTA